MTLISLVLSASMALSNVALTSSAPATSSEVEGLEAEAIKAYEAGNFRAAAEKFEAAYEASDDPNYLYNIGRVYEEAGRLERAIEYYEQFVRAEGVGLDTRMVASERLSQLKAITGKSNETQSDEPATDAEDEAAQGAGEQSNLPVSGPPTDEDKPAVNKSLAISGAVLLGVGAPVAIAGAIVGGLAIRSNDRLDTQQLDDPAAAQRSGRSQALTADVMVPVGSALAVTGVALLVVHSIRKSRARKTALTPTGSPTTAGLALSGRF